MPNLPPESASKRPSPEALRCPSGQASVTKKTRSIYKELNGNVVRDRAENCPCKNRVTLETATTTTMWGPPTALFHQSSPTKENHFCANVFCIITNGGDRVHHGHAHHKARVSRDFPHRLDLNWPLNWRLGPRVAATTRQPPRLPRCLRRHNRLPSETYHATG